MEKLKVATALGGVALLVSIAGCANTADSAVGESSSSSSSNSAATPAYVALIDAGSKGSRLYLYKNDSTDGQVKVSSPYSLDPDPGPAGYGALASYVSHPSDAGPLGIKPLVDGLKSYLASNSIPESAVPVDVMATAGMREVNLTDPNAVTQIYASVKSTVEGAGFTPDTVGTLSGRREALYSWTDVNEEKGAFGPGGEAKAKGTVEIGGASSQVAFSTTPTDSPNVIKIDINGKDYSVFSMSFLGLGRNSARRDTIPAQAATEGSFCYPHNAEGAQPTAYTEGNPVGVSASKSDYSATACTDAYDATIAKAGASAFNKAENQDVLPTQVGSVPGFGSTDFVGLAGAFDAFDKFKADTAPELSAGLAAKCPGLDGWKKVSALSKKKPLADKSVNLCANATFIQALVLSNDGLNVAPDKFTPYPLADTQTWTRGRAILIFSGNAEAGS